MKKKSNITTKRRIAIICLFLLWGTGGLFGGLSAAAQSTMQVTPLSATYTTSPTIQFRVSWTSQTATNHLPKAWVIIDYDKVENNVAANNWQPATITGIALTTNGTISQQSTRGFFLEGAQTNFSATVTVALSGMPAQFNWCAYALDYPPQAVIKAAGGYELKGTLPFTVNGTKLGNDVKTYGAGTCITTLSDATNNPTSVIPAKPTVATSNPAARCGAGAVTLNASASGGTTTAMTYTWIVGGGTAQITTTGSLSLSSVGVGSTTYSVTVTNANGCTSTAKTGTITVYTAFTAGTITTAAGTATAGTNPNVTIANNTDASGGDGTITYEWRRSGTSSATFSYSYTTYPISNSASNYATAGTYYFTRYAKDGYCNTSFAQSNGLYTLTVASYVPPYSSGTWSCGTQTWSGALRNPAGCSAMTALSTAATPPAQYYDRGTSYGYYYNWTCVNSYGTTLCPSPWRVPTPTDFDILVTCAGGNNSTGGSAMLSAWGATGYTRGNEVQWTANSYFWSSVSSGNSARYMSARTYDLQVPWADKFLGMLVRCVR